MWRSLVYYRNINLAVVAAVAVASSVLTGAFMVGDSVNRSLASLTLERLGAIDVLIASEHLVSQDLAEKLAGGPGSPAGNLRVEPLLLLRGGATAQGRRASRVQVSGILPGFAEFFPSEDEDRAPLISQAFTRQAGQVFPSAVINRGLSRELGLDVGDELVVSFENPSAIHRDSVYGRKNTVDVVKKMRVTVRSILPERGMGRFGLNAQQQEPLNLFLPLADIQRTLAKPGLVNSLVCGDDGGPVLMDLLAQRLSAVLSLEDANLKLHRGDDYLSLESPSFYLKPGIETAALAVLGEMGAPVMPVSTYLANRIQAGGNATPYSLVSALERVEGLGELQAVSGTAVPEDGEAVLTQWAADDLQIAVGDTLTMTYFALGEDDALKTATASFRLAGVVSMEGLSVDRNLAPDFPGVQDAEDMSNWDPPFEVDLSAIRPKDEDYWDRYRTAPKAFVTLSEGRRLWANRFGEITAIRFGPAPDMDLTETGERLSRELLARIEPETAGYRLVPIREQGQRAAVGSNDFRGLFMAFSFFIIISSALLVGQFFRLMVEQRHAEAGVLAAVGFPARAVRNRFLKEGLALCATGAVIGVLGGFAYAALMMAGLRTWWFLGTTHLYFHFQPASLVWGALISLLVALISITGSVRRIAREAPTALISGLDQTRKARRGRWARAILVASLIGATSMLAASPWVAAPAGLFFGIGACLLLAGLSAMALKLRDRRVALAVGGTWSMAGRNTGRHAGRSLVCVSLVATACFTIVAVGLARHSGEVNADDRGSGTGGFFLEAEAAIPLHQSLDSPEGRAGLGLGDELSAQLDQGQNVALRLRPGEDASCLNLFAPQRPRILGIPEVEPFSGRFAFHSHRETDDPNPWTLLEQTFEDGAIPAIGDQNSVQWILHLGLGQDFVMADNEGKEIRLRLVGLLQGSIFQSELLISEAHFQEHFPQQSGYGYFLFESAAQNRQELAAALEEALFDYGLDAASTSEKVARFHAIENTYISIFQMLGGLGLLLGTLGLGAIIYRNAVERRGEFAAMRAFGFSKRRLARLLLAENTVLIALGIAIGSIAAVVAMAPHFLSVNAQPSVTVLFLTLAAVFSVGLIASAWAVRKTNRFPLLAALRSE